MVLERNNGKIVLRTILPKRTYYKLVTALWFLWFVRTLAVVGASLAFLLFLIVLGDSSNGYIPHTAALFCSAFLVIAIASTKKLKVIRMLFRVR